MLHVEPMLALSNAAKQQDSSTLPPVTVEAPRLHAKPRQAPKRELRKPPSVMTRTAAAKPSPQVTVGGSGAPNVGSGPAGTPNMASQMTISGEDLNARPVTRPGEVLEAVPGLIVTQHSGDGKANQYFLRGYNLDHSTDLAITVDDVPVNMRTHAHGQG
jgi:outer membrane receptor for Fe3+-dicitrate